MHGVAKILYLLKNNKLIYSRNEMEPFTQFVLWCTGYGWFNLGFNFLEHSFLGINNNQSKRCLNKFGGHVHCLKIAKLDVERKIGAIFQHTFWLCISRVEAEEDWGNDNAFHNGSVKVLLLYNARFLDMTGYVQYMCCSASW